MISSRSPGEPSSFPSRQSSCSESSYRQSTTPTIITFNNNISFRNNMNIHAQYAVTTFENHPQNLLVDDCGESDVGFGWDWKSGCIRRNYSSIIHFPNFAPNLPSRSRFCFLLFLPVTFAMGLAIFLRVLRGPSRLLIGYSEALNRISLSC